MVIHYFIGITRDISSQFREAEARRRERKGWLGGCRCTLRSAVSITHPSAVSTSPNRRFCRRTDHFSCSNLFRPLSTLSTLTTDLPLFPFVLYRFLVFVFMLQEIFVRFLDHCFPYVSLSHTPVSLQLL